MITVPIWLFVLLIILSIIGLIALLVPLIIRIIGCAIAYQTDEIRREIEND